MKTELKSLGKGKWLYRNHIAKFESGFYWTREVPCNDLTQFKETVDYWLDELVVLED